MRFAGQNVASVGGGKYVVKEEHKDDSQFDEIDDKQLISMCEKAEKVYIGKFKVREIVM